MISGTIAYIRWFGPQVLDAANTEDLPTLSEMESAGLLLEDTEKYVVLALDRCIDTGDLNCCLCIPKVNIRSIHKFSLRGRK